MSKGIWTPIKNTDNNYIITRTVATIGPVHLIEALEGIGTHACAHF